MDYKIIDAHAHLWLKQDAVVDGKEIRTLTGGKSIFLGEVRQMMPPYMVDGANTAEIFLANMDYAQVSGAVITQEYIDGNQNDYLLEVAAKYPDRFLVCGLAEFRTSGYFDTVKKLYEKGFRAVKVPAQRLLLPEGRIYLTCDEMMKTFKFMEEKGMILSIDLADGAEQVKEMEEVIAECPNLKIAIGHFAMVTRAEWQEQVKLARHKNVMIESGGITWLFHPEFYPYSGAVWAIKEAAELVGMDKLMWGSDYPRTMSVITYRMSYDFVQKTNLLKDDEKAKFLGRNAEAFYGFKNLPELPYILSMVE